MSFQRSSVGQRNGLWLDYSNTWKDQFELKDSDSASTLAQSLWTPLVTYWWWVAFGFILWDAVADVGGRWEHWESPAWWGIGKSATPLDRTCWKKKWNCSSGMTFLWQIKTSRYQLSCPCWVKVSSQHDATTPLFYHGDGMFCVTTYTGLHVGQKVPLWSYLTHTRVYCVRLWKNVCTYTSSSCHFSIKPILCGEELLTDSHIWGVVLVAPPEL